MSGFARAPPSTGLLIDGDRVTGVRLADGSEIVRRHRRRRDRCLDPGRSWRRTAIDVPIRVVREQIVMISPGVEIGHVPVFSDLVSLQYIRPETRW